MEERSYAKECGLRCSRLRMAKGLSQQELAEKVFTTAQNISKYEKNGISNIDMIRRISDALGHDLLVAESDAEGTVGEVGKEILWVLIKCGGYKDVSGLIQQDMFGMSVARVNQEIFKLEHIGMCVREQYIDFDEKSQDQLFITAKGLITYKSLIGRSVLNNSEIDAIGRAVSYERLIGTAESYQDFVNKREVEKLIRNLDPYAAEDYRLNYVQYLKRNFERGIAHDPLMLYDYANGCVPAQGFYHDLIYRMAMHLDQDMLRTILFGEHYDQAEDDAMSELEDQLSGKPQDYTIRNAEELLKKEFPKIEEVEITSEGLRTPPPMTEQEKEDNDLLMSYYSKTSVPDLYVYEPQRVFQKSLEEGHTTPYPTRWYTDEKIREFIVQNLKPVYQEKAKELDTVLKKINELEPRTLQYYRFPWEWRNNGLEKLVCEIYGLPYSDPSEDEDEDEDTGGNK